MSSPPRTMFAASERYFETIVLNFCVKKYENHHALPQIMIGMLEPSI